MPAVQETIAQVKALDVDKYKYGFTTDIEFDLAPKGLREDTVRFISAKKDEPQWMTEWRLEAFRRWQTMKEPNWARVHYPKIDYQDLHYYAAPKRDALASLDEVDPEILATYARLGIPLKEQEILAGVRKGGNGEEATANMPAAASRSTPCSIPSRWRPPSRRSLPRPASSSCRSPRRSASIRNW